MKKLGYSLLALTLLLCGKVSPQSVPTIPPSADLDQIGKDYSENAVAADLRYKGKILTVTGKVRSIQNESFYKGMVGRIELESRTYTNGNSWYCSFDTDRTKEIAKVHNGQIVVLKGQFVRFLNFYHCAVVSVADPPAEPDPPDGVPIDFSFFDSITTTTRADAAGRPISTQTKNLCIKGRGVVTSIAPSNVSGNTPAVRTIAVSGKLLQKPLVCTLNSNVSDALLNLSTLEIGDVVLVDGCSDGERNRGVSVPHFHCNLTNVSKMTYMPRYNWDPHCQGATPLRDSPLDKYCRSDSK